jgi:hypothetical protein
VWFDCRGGQVVVKNPDRATIAKMIALARRLQGHVEGDDGEVYEETGRPPRPARATLFDRLSALTQRWRAPRTLEPVTLHLRVGDRVRDARHREGQIMAIDLKAEHGLGIIRVRFDDGRELALAAAAHGLQRLDS